MFSAFGETLALFWDIKSTRPQASKFSTYGKRPRMLRLAPYTTYRCKSAAITGVCTGPWTRLPHHIVPCAGVSTLTSLRYIMKICVGRILSQTQAGLT